MAISKYSDFLERIKDGANTFGWTNTLARTAPFPVEKYSIFNSYEDAVTYASNEGLAYEGQIIAVTENGAQSVYVIDTKSTNNLRKLATGGDATEIENKLNTEISNRQSADNYLSNEISTIQKTTLPTLSTTLEENLSIDVAVEAGTGDILSSYVISQGGNAKTVKIDIPKDKVITNAEVVKDPKGKPAGTYLKLTIQNVADPLYVPVPALASVYTGHDGDTVKVDVVNTSGEAFTISAIVKTGSIGAEHLTTGLSTAINNVITSDADVRSTVATLSGEGEGSFKYADQQLSNALTVVINGISSTLSDDLKAEITRAKNAENVISTAVDNKITIDGLSSSQLHMLHISQDEYHQLVVAGNVDPHTVYVVSSDNLNMYDEKIINVAAGTDEKDAVNVGQLSTVSADLQTKINTTVTSGINELSGKIFTPTTGLKAVLEKAITDETTARETADNAISNNLTAEVNRATTVESGLADRLTTLETTTVPNAITTANSHTNAVSAELSNDYVAKIGAEKSRAEGAEKDLSDRLDVIEGSGEGSVAKALADAKSYANDISTALSTDYTGKIDALETTLTGSYVLKSVAENASADDKLVKASTVDNKITAAIDALDVTKLSLTQAESISSIEEVDGKIVVGKQAIQITTNQVTGLDTALNARVLTANAENATSNDKLVKSTTVNTRINNTVAAISVDTTTIPASKTLATYKQENGKVAYTTQDIQIAESQVTNLTTHLNNKLELTAFDAYKNEVGLSAASSTNVVVTKKDIADLVGAMHFVGVKGSTDEVTNPKAGDIVIVGTKEFVYGGNPAKWYELGDEGIYLTKDAFEAWKTSTYAVKMSAIDLSVAGLSGALSTEAETRATNDTVLSNAITAINDWKATTLETRLTGIKKDITDEVAARTAITNELSNVNNTWKASVDSSLTSINQTIANNKTAIDNALTAEIDRAKAAEKAVDDRVTELSTYTHALSVSQLVWDIDVINCGGAM